MRRFRHGAGRAAGGVGHRAPSFDELKAHRACQSTRSDLVYRDEAVSASIRQAWTKLEEGGPGSPAIRFPAHGPVHSHSRFLGDLTYDVTRNTLCP